MEKKVYIFSSNTDSEAVDRMQQEITARGYEVVVTRMTRGGIMSSYVEEAPVGVLWISPETSSEVYDLSRRRNASSLTTINYFAEPTALNQDEKESIGSNRTVFASLTSGKEVEEVCELLDTLPANTWNQEISRTNFVATKPKERMEDINTKVNSQPEKTEANTIAETTENNEEKPKGLKPWNVLVALIFVVFGELVVENLVNIKDYYRDDLLPYVVFSIALILSLYYTGCVIQYRERYGKSFFSGFVYVCGLLVSLNYAWFIVENLWKLFFGS